MTASIHTCLAIRVYVMRILVFKHKIIMICQNLTKSSCRPSNEMQNIIELQQEPITRSMQLLYNRVRAFSQTCLFLDRIFDKFRLPREPRLLITSFANLIIKLSVIKSPWRLSMGDKCMESTDDSAGKRN